MSTIRTENNERVIAEASQEGKKYISELKQQFSRDAEDIKTKTTREKIRMTKDYELQLTGEKNKFEQELIALRKKYENLKSLENDRLSRELDDIKLSHQEKIVKLRKNQEREIEKYQETQKNFLDSINEKMAAERLKHGA